MLTALGIVVLLLVDRVAYLYRSMVLKALVHFVVVIMVHILLCFEIVFDTGRFEGDRTDV